MPRRTSTALAWLVAQCVFVALLPPATASAAPRLLIYGCASKEDGVLRYIARPGRCERQRERLVDFRAERMETCVSRRRIRRASTCRRGERAMLLPALQRTYMCASPEEHLLRIRRRGCLCGGLALVLQPLPVPPVPGPAPDPA